MRRRIGYFVLISVLLFVQQLTAQGNAALSRLNNYQYLVVKEENSVQDYKDHIYTKVLEVLKACNLPSPSDRSILYSPSFDQSKVITLVYTITNPSNTSGQVSCLFKFVNYDYETIASNTTTDRYQLLNEKNYLKSVAKCLTFLDGYQYKFEGQVQSKEPVAKNEAAPPKRSVAAEDEDAELHAVNIDMSEIGKYYALIIGVSNYIDPAIPDLDSLPVKDAIRVGKTLNTFYTFEKENMTVLKDPTRRDIVIALDNLSKNVTPNDNVLIFYAGHGHYEDDNGIGYWFPRDAEAANSSNWLYNDQLVASLKKIKSLHTLLISDACFSGSIFKTRSVNLTAASEFIKKKYQLPSRKAITSGTLKTVPNKSIFIKYLIENLTNNHEKYMTGSELFHSLETPVGNNAPSVPQFGVIQNVGDEGGDFVFIRRN
ncbi:MAG: caspase family protein [bacterium]|nr:caspase family protein [bacterium]